jgi:peroxiredoxin Q/BCP
MGLSIGQEAPDFDVTSSAGKRLRLSDFRGQKNVVLYFYPKDFTKVCTRESCGFRDMYGEIADIAEVIGVSLDSDESHERFAKEHALTFPLVADADRSLARKYGAVGALRGFLGIAKRVTFVIDKGGKIAGIFTGELDAERHLSGVKGALAKLR